MTWNPNWQQNPWYTGTAGPATGQASSAATMGAQMATAPGVQPAIAGTQEEQATQATTEYAPPAVPLVDIVDSPDELVVLVDTPGFEKEELEIHADGNALYISGDRQDRPAADPDKGEQSLRNERPLRLERSITLPMQIDPENVIAKHENGVCRITVPKDEQEKRHEIAFQ